MTQAPCRIAVAILVLLIGVETQAEFGSVPLTRDPNQTTPLYAAPKASPSTPSSSVSTPPPPASLPSGPAGKKWLQHESGYVILVDADQAPGPGFKEIHPPVQSPGTPTVTTQPPVAPPAPVVAQPSYQAPVPPTYAQPQAPTTFTNSAFSQPSVAQPAPSAYSMPAPAVTASGVPPGKKWMQHKSGYRVIVDQNTMPGPEFVDIPPPSTASANPMMQPTYPQNQHGYAPVGQQPSQVPQSAFSQQSGYTPQVAQGPQTYSQIF